MKIGIDIDDVITDTSSTMKDYILKQDTNGEITSHIEEIMRGDANTPAIEQFFKDNILYIFKNAIVKENASAVIQRLLEKGHEIYIITSRGEQKKIFKGSESLTLEYLKLNNINYTKIIFSCSDKAKVCKDNNIDVMVDDSIKYCEEIRNENIKSILFTSTVNKSLYTTVQRVNNWLELEEKLNTL
jgi:uncharacterized HAD superfamily protein